VRHLRYLELPPWIEVAETARQLCRDVKEVQALERLWRTDDPRANRPVPDLFGPRLKEKRKRLGISRRELADLFGIGGKKPARIIKYIEEDGFYSPQAYPPGLAAVPLGKETPPPRVFVPRAERPPRGYPPPT